MTTLFWTDKPEILITNMDVFPNSTMIFEEKINAISRLVILLTFIGFCITRRISLIIVCCLTLGILYALYKKQNRQQTIIKEGFDKNSNKKKGKREKEDEPNNYQVANDSTIIADIISTNPAELTTVPLTDFNPINKKNPMGNVLLTEINDTPNRLAAPPAFNPDIYEDINGATKKQTQYLNPDIKNTDKQLYGDLGDNFKFDKEMMRNFYSTANTRVCNDQGAFAQFLYGDMPSGKSSGPDGAFARVQDNPRYNLY